MSEPGVRLAHFGDPGYAVYLDLIHIIQIVATVHDMIACLAAQTASTLFGRPTRGGDRDSAHELTSARRSAAAPLFGRTRPLPPTVFAEALREVMGESVGGRQSRGREVA